MFANIADVSWSNTALLQEPNKPASHFEIDSGKVVTFPFFYADKVVKIKTTLMIFMGLGQFWLYAADYSMNRNCLKAYDFILELRFDEAQELLKKEKTSNPSNSIIPYLENYRDFLRIIISEEEPVFNSLSDQKKNRLAQLESGNAESPWHLYCQAQVNMQWAFARIKFGEYTTAALELNRSYRQVTRNKELFPDFSPNDAVLGLLHVLIGSVPDNYKWLSEALAFRGSVNQGIAEFRKIIEDTETQVHFPFLRSEGLFLFSFITLNFSALPEDSKHLTGLLESPENKALIAKSPLLVYAASINYLNNGKNDLALGLLQNRPKGPAYFPFYYLEYLTGTAKLHKLDPEARLNFLRFVVNFKGKNFIKSAYQRLAWLELLKDNESGYKDYMTRVKLLGSKDLDGDRQAMKDAASQKPPDLTLLKARLLFDGGYYSKALSELKNAGPEQLASPGEKIEYTYRLARIHHKSGNTREAILNYSETLTKGAAFPFYFAANSALQLGLIYEASGNKEKARSYYRKCLSLKYNEYQNSISQKAKAGLSRLK